MHAHIIKPAPLIAALASALLVVAMPWQRPATPSTLEALDKLKGQWVGRPAPSFALPDLDGKPHTLADYRGKVVFLNFWGSFCAPCRKEMPSMERLVREYKERGLVMVAISFDPKVEDAAGFMQQFLPGERSAMTVLHDPEAATGVAYGTEKLPETYIIDRQGRIIARFVNAYDWTSPEVKQLIEATLNDRSLQDRSVF